MPAHLFDTSLLQAPLVMPQPQRLNQTTDTLIYVARQQQAITGFILPITSTQGYSGPIKLVVGISAQGQVTGVRVTEHRETPGLGDKIDYQKTHWVDGFIGSDLLTHHWAVKKDGGDFDQFTGATITPRAVVNAVANSLHYFAQHQAQLMHLAQANLEPSS
jgi:electron transport complex protein RnfG